MVERVEVEWATLLRRRQLFGYLLVSVAVAAVVFVHAPASAQVVVVADDGVTEVNVRRWRARVEAALDSPVQLETWARAREPVGTVSEARLEVLSLIETLIVRARHARSRLLERDATLALARAEEIVLRHLDIPGMAAWYAEVQLAIAITAAQAGQEGVSQAALRRAASVDPDRTVQAAEARPEVVERARAIAQAAATAPRGRFEVRSDAEGAVAFVDDVRVGSLPVTVEASVGPHVLRVDAPGHQSWASVVMVFEGDRPPVRVALAATPHLAAARDAARAAIDDDRGALTSALAALETPMTIYRVQPGTGGLDRAVLVVCTATGCRPPQLLEGELGPVLVSGGPVVSRADAARWLRERPDIIVDDPEWWDRWYVWLTAGLVAAAAIAVGSGVALGQGDERPPLILIVDPGELPVSGVD